MFEQVSDYTELFSDEEWASIDLGSWDESDSSVLISLLTSWLSDLRDRLATENDIRTADLIDDLVSVLRRSRSATRPPDEVGPSAATPSGARQGASL